MAGDYTRMLDYSIGGGPMIWRSPLWMLLAWEVVAVQFGYIGLGLWERFGKTDLLMIGLLGAINIPFYERDGAPNSLLVAIQRLPNAFVHRGDTPPLANLVLLWCSHCWCEPFRVIRGASPLLAASLAEH